MRKKSDVDSILAQARMLDAQKRSFEDLRKCDRCQKLVDGPHQCVGVHSSGQPEGWDA